MLVSSLTACNTTVLEKYDYEAKLEDFEWQRRIYHLTGEAYIIRDAIFYGNHYDSTFYTLNGESGAIEDTLPHISALEKEPGILVDSITKYHNGFSTHQVLLPGEFTAKTIHLKNIHAQYRGDHHTYFPTVKLAGQREVKIKFNRDQFKFIADIVAYRKKYLVIVFNGRSAHEHHPFENNIGVIDLEEIINQP